MADLKNRPRRDREDAAHSLLYLRDDQLRTGIELMFFAYRDFTAGPDAELADLGFGRAHHRVIHFVGAKPGLTVMELLKILRITKQSLSRVLKQLVEQGFVASQPGGDDRRKRELTLTAKGQELERRISAVQRERVAHAFREAGPEAVLGWRRVLENLIDADERGWILDFVDRRGA